MSNNKCGVAYKANANYRGWAKGIRKAITNVFSFATEDETIVQAFSDGLFALVWDIRRKGDAFTIATTTPTADNHAVFVLVSITPDEYHNGETGLKVIPFIQTVKGIHIIKQDNANKVLACGCALPKATGLVEGITADSDITATAKVIEIITDGIIKQVRRMTIGEIYALDLARQQVAVSITLVEGNYSHNLKTGEGYNYALENYDDQLSKKVAQPTWKPKQ